MRRTKEECLDALHTAADMLDESPSKPQYERLGLTPASATIIRILGGWNEAKEAAGLSTSPSRGPRVGKKPEGVELPSDSSWDELSVDQRWHYRNREWNTERTLRRRAEHRRWLASVKREAGCTNCEESHPASLVFHHVEEKNMAVNKMVPYGYSKEKIKAEIDRCQVLCANCHRKTHANTSASQPGQPPQTTQRKRRRGDLKRLVREEKMDRGGCSRCGEDDTNCLEFHHRDLAEKTRSISGMVSDEVSIPDLKQELAKCDLLCANCHRREHHEPPTRAEEAQD